MRRNWFLTLVLAAPVLAYGQGACNTSHLTIFDANVAEFTEERMPVLQPGLNTLEWRSLMPQAIIRTIRVAGERVTVVRQEVTYDGPDVRNQKTPVLHLTVQNDGASGPRRLEVDYLAPNLSWKGDYSLLLGPPVNGAPPEEMLLDGWVTVQNDTGVDVCAGIVDLVAGEVQLLLAGGGSGQRDYQSNAQMAQLVGGMVDEGVQGAGAEITGVSVFSRLRLGRNISMNANALINRFPLFQRLKPPVEQRHVFENEARAQTLGRGGFMLLPRGLEVRLVSKNSSPSPLPMGTVTVYSQEGEVPQVVGQDRIPLTPVGADFSVTQGRSNVSQGTRRIVDRREAPDPTPRDPRHEKLVTRVEVVITNRGATALTAFVREGVEAWGNGEWSVTQSSHPHQRLGERMLEFKLPVPAKGDVKLEYTVEIR
ncbi:MAG: hypothetical protein ABSD27_07885 [Bryobacteraceae bacterium]|jgi:hypothetical protein